MHDYLLDEKMQITVLVLLLWSNSVYLQMDRAVTFTYIPSVLFGILDASLCSLGKLNVMELTKFSRGTMLGVNFCSLCNRWVWFVSHRLPWEQLFEPVINITRDGFEPTEHTGELCACAVPRSWS